MANVFLCSPTHNGQLDNRMAKAFFAEASQDHRILNVVQQSSLLANACNNLWCTALNVKDQYNLTWFAMLHSDIIPEPFWIDKLIRIAEEKGADLLSAIVPIKSDEGVTSTAVSHPNSRFGASFRLTQHQVNNVFPETFSLQDLVDGGHTNVDPTTHDLMVNTGCMICRLDKGWWTDVYFTIADRIEYNHGKFYAQVDSEDWFFSKCIADNGGKVMATRAIKVQHLGTTAFHSDRVWGSEFDPHFLIPPKS